MPGDASLARLFREYGDRWVIERVDRGTEWVACRRDGDLIDIIGARDLGGLRYHMDAAEKEEAAVALPSHRPPGDSGASRTAGLPG